MAVTDARATEGLYLLHLEPRYLHAGHYLGWSNDVAARVREHLSAGRRSSPLIAAAIHAGCVVTLARVWPDATRTDEARMKRHHGLARHCPTCRTLGRWPR